MDWMKYRFIYFGFSLTLIVISIFSIIFWGFKFGVDFKGGSIVEYRYSEAISTEDATKKLEAQGIEVSSVSSIGENSYLFRLPPADEQQKTKIEGVLNDVGKNADELRFESVGPSIGPDLITKTIYAIAIAATLILLWVALQFKSFKYGTSAVLAMFHDSFILIGSFSVLGHFFGAEVDFLFFTALLTTLSFSVHDTIVVYDRVRETQRKEGGEIYALANRAVSETMVRSLNNSFTILFMLVALILLGGTTTMWFAVALFVGTVMGTYSSPFVAVSLLVTWDRIEDKIRERRNS